MEVNKLHWIFFFVLLSFSIYAALVMADRTIEKMAEQKAIRDALKIQTDE